MVNVLRICFHPLIWPVRFSRFFCLATGAESLGFWSADGVGIVRIWAFDDDRVYLTGDGYVETTSGAEDRVRLVAGMTPYRLSDEQYFPDRIRKRDPAQVAAAIKKIWPVDEAVPFAPAPPPVASRPARKAVKAIKSAPKKAAKTVRYGQP